MKSTEWYRALFEALQVKDASELAEVAHGILGMPVVVTDAAFIVRAKYPAFELDDEQWDANTLNRQIEPRFIRTFSEDDHFARHDQAGAAILTDWGHYESAPRLTEFIHSSDGEVIGYFAALATGADIQDWHYEAVDVICKAFSMLMDDGRSMPFVRSGFMSPTLYALLDGSYAEGVDPSVISEGFAELNPAPHLLFCARPRHLHDKPLEVYLGNVLCKYFEQAIAAIHQDMLYILASGVPGDARGSVRGQLLVEELDRQKLVSGVSRKFDSLEDIRAKKWEAEASLRVGMCLGLQSPLVHYEDVMYDVVCETLDSQFPQDALETPALAALKRHDAENGTSYFVTLKAYIETDFERKRTCEILHIHRNTLQYRLDRIAEIGNFDVNDGPHALYFLLEDYRARARKAAKSSGCRNSARGE